ncbi:MAG: alpha/beta fold hydrolase [Alphaproteobacteria bacterium]
MSARAAFALEEGPVRSSLRMWDGEVSVLGWESAGPKAPAVHFAHANGFNALAYRTLFDELSLYMRIHAIDLRGHGQTTLASNPKGLKSWQVHADDIVRTIQEIDGKARILAGHSIGATASLMAALDQPQWVTGLVLVEPVLLPPSQLRRRALERFLGLHNPPRLTRRKRGIFPSREAMFEAYRSRGAFRSWPEEVVRDYVTGGSLDYLDFRQVRLACTPGWEEANYLAGPPDLWRRLGGLQVPVTFLLAQHRSTCSDETVELLADRLPDARILRVPDTTHFLPFEQPAAVRAELRLMAHASERHARNDKGLEGGARGGRDVPGLAGNEVH